MEAPFGDGSCTAGISSEASKDKLQAIYTILQHASLVSNSNNGSSAKLSAGMADCNSSHGASVSALRTRITSLEIELEDKTQSLNAASSMLDQRCAMEEQIKHQIQFQYQNELERANALHNEAITNMQKQNAVLESKNKQLSIKAGVLIEELRGLEKKFINKSEEMHNYFERNCERQRKAFVAAEKMRRDAWEREKTQEIKDITIKGLEPEIQRLIDRQRTDKRKLEECVRRMTDEMQDKLQHEIAEAQCRLKQDYDAAFKKKVTELREKYEQQETSHKMETEKEKAENSRKLTSQAEQWRQKLLSKEAECKNLIKCAREDERKACNIEIKNLKATLKLLEQKYSQDISALNENNKLMLNELKANLEAENNDAKIKIRLQVKNETEAECKKINEAIIVKMNKDHIEAQEIANKRFEEAFEAAKIQWTLCRKDLETQKELQAAEIKTASEIRMELERQVLRQSEEIRHLREIKNEQEDRMKKLNDKIQEMTNLSDGEATVLREELERSKNNCEQLRKELEQLRRDNATAGERLISCTEIIAAQKEREQKTLEDLAEKIKESFRIKDEHLNAVKDEVAAAETKAAHLKHLLEQQRGHWVKTMWKSTDLTETLYSGCSTSASLPPDNSLFVSNDSNQVKLPSKLSAKARTTTSKGNQRCETQRSASQPHPRIRSHQKGTARLLSWTGNTHAKFAR